MAKVKRPVAAADRMYGGGSGAGYAEMNRFEKAREEFRPDPIKTLFVAEAPPPVDSERFFYFERVPRGDSLFLEMMKVLFPSTFVSAPEARKQKRRFLDKFKSDGFFLIDAVEDPLPKRAARSMKKREIRNSLPRLQAKLKVVCGPDTRIVLISRHVYDICLSPLRAQGFNVINTEMIDFPAAGRQVHFRRKLTRLLRLAS